MSYETLKTLAPLLKELTIGELEAVRDVAWDIKSALEKAEKEKFKKIINELEGVRA